MKEKKRREIDGPVPFIDSGKAHQRTMKFFQDQIKKSKKRGKNGKN